MQTIEECGHCFTLVKDLDVVDKMSPRAKKCFYEKMVYYYGW